MRDILLRPKWLLGHVLALGLVGLFVALGLWQLSRHEERRERNAAIEAGMAQPPVAFADLPVGPQQAGAYRPVVVRGTWIGWEVLVTPRGRDGAPGHHVLTALAADDGRLLLVDRGWVPFALGTPPVAEAVPTPGEVTVHGILVPPSRADARLVRDDGGRPLRIAAVRPGELAGEFEEPQRVFTGGWLVLQGQDPPARSVLPVTPPAPVIEAGPHLSYAMQWFAFVLVGLVGYPLLLRRTLRDAREEAL